MVRYSRIVSDLFASTSNTSDFKAKLQQAVQGLAREHIFIGTSSWKYPGWCGQIYEEQRYCHRGRFAKARFERDCLAEYAETFRTVCVDAVYYQFPSEQFLTGLVTRVPADFQFACKVTDDLTLKRFPNLPRFGRRAGQANAHFLDADLFHNAFLKPCVPFRRNLGLLLFEFSRFHPADYERGRDFLADLDRFFARLPAGWNYGVEIRNREWLQPEYFATLRQHGVVHVFNNWQAMPAVAEQMKLPGSETSDTTVAARFLLKPGRKYEDAVKEFSPYQAVKEVNAEARTAGAKLLGAARQAGKQAFIFVNNRLEGNALETIHAMVAGIGP